MIQAMRIENRVRFVGQAVKTRPQIVGWQPDAREVSEQLKRAFQTGVVFDGLQGTERFDFKPTIDSTSAAASSESL